MVKVWALGTVVTIAILFVACFAHMAHAQAEDEIVRNNTVISDNCQPSSYNATDNVDCIPDLAKSLSEIQMKCMINNGTFTDNCISTPEENCNPDDTECLVDHTRLSLAGPVSIAALYPFDSKQEVIGKTIVTAMELAVADFNEYLVDREAAWWLDLRHGNTAANPVTALTRMQVLDRQGIDLIVGSMTDSSLQNIKYYADENNMLLVSCCSTSINLAIADDSVFRLVPDDMHQITPLIRIFEDVGIEAIVPVWGGEPYGDILHGALTSAFKERGGFVYSGLRYNPDTPEFSREVDLLSEYVQEAVDAYGTERIAIVVVSFDRIDPLMQRAAHHDILGDVRWFGLQTYADSSTFADPNTLTFANKVSFTYVKFSPGGGDLYNSVTQRIINLTSYAPMASAYSMYDAIWIIGKSIEAANSTDARAVGGVLPSVSDKYDGALYRTVLNDNGDLSLANYGIWQIQNSTQIEVGMYVAEQEIIATALQPVGEIKIGSLYSLAKEHMSLEYDALSGTRMGIDDFNSFLDRIGANWTLSLVSKDPGSNATDILENTEMLLADGIDIVLGPIDDDRVNHVLPYTDANNMMLFSCCSTANELAIADDSLFRLAPSHKHLGSAMGTMFEIQGIDAVVPLWRNTEYGRALLNATQIGFQIGGGVVDNGISYEPDTMNFSAPVSALAAEVQRFVEQYGDEHVAVFLISYDESVQIMQTASDYDILGNVRWFGSEMLSKNDLIINDVVSNEFANRVAFTTIQINDRSPFYEHLGQRFGEQYGLKPTAVTYRAYSAPWLVGLSVLMTGMDSAESVKEVIGDVILYSDGFSVGKSLNDVGDLIVQDSIMWTVHGNEWRNLGHYPVYDD